MPKCPVEKGASSYRPVPKDDAAVVARLKDLASEYRRYGCPRLSNSPVQRMMLLWNWNVGKQRHSATPAPPRKLLFIRHRNQVWEEIIGRIGKDW